MEVIPAILIFGMFVVVTSSQNVGENLGYGRNYNSVLQSQFMDVNAAIAIEEKLSKVNLNLVLRETRGGAGTQILGGPEVKNH